MTIIQDEWIDRFEAFARSKPADEEYPGWSISSCALAQFGYPGLASWTCERFGVPVTAYRAAVPNPGDGPCTFGALADRLAALKVVKEGEGG